MIQFLGGRDSVRAGAPRLEQKLHGNPPGCIWFHGKLAYDKFLKYASPPAYPVEWGLQPIVIADAKVFVTPNPSPANAAFSLQDLIDWYDELARAFPPQPRRSADARQFDQFVVE